MIRVGVIGVGKMGADHARNLASRIAGATVTVLFDLDRDRAASVAVEVGAITADSESAVIEHPEVDAVVIASSAATHAPLTLAAIEAGKPCFCEKPLALASTESRAVVEAELAHGRRLVQVGFMRRFDAGYLELKRCVSAGEVGQPLLSHMWHRNPHVPETFGDAEVMHEALTHEMDITRWLFGEEIVSLRSVIGTSSHKAHRGLHDPQLLIMATTSGVVVSAESRTPGTVGIGQ